MAIRKKPAKYIIDDLSYNEILDIIAALRETQRVVEVATPPTEACDAKWGSLAFRLQTYLDGVGG